MSTPCSASTALHWIPSGDLVDVYRACATLLAPGGVLVNCDNMDYPSALEDDPPHRRRRHVTRACSDSGRTRRRPRFEGWEQWWENVAAAPELAELYEERMRRFGWRDLGEYRPGLAVHAAILEEAGFREVDTVWQRYQNRVLLAIR